MIVGEKPTDIVITREDDIVMFYLLENWIDLEET